jgi:D-inositol-3-phosphate glycosyltransferase
MISFVWSAKYPFWAGAGGSENYTAGQVRELQRRGIPTRIITLGHGTDDGREDFPDIPFTNIAIKEELSQLDDTLVFVTYPLDVPTKRPSFAILHCPPSTCGQGDPLFNAEGVYGKQLLAPSRFASKMWSRQLRGSGAGRIPAVYPFAELAFSQVKRPPASDGVTRILFAGRLTPDKGIYTLLASLHLASMQNLRYHVTATTAGAHTEHGKLILPLLQAHPNITVVPARRTPQETAQLMARHDIVVVPSSNIFWQEIFGIVSVEAQHAGCRVVASNAGGLPETDCGGVVLTRPDDPLSLANGIIRAKALGPLTNAERLYACTKFTVRESVDRLLAVIGAREYTFENRTSLYKQGALVREQLDGAIKRGIARLGLGVTGNDELSYRQAR